MHLEEDISLFLLEPDKFISNLLQATFIVIFNSVQFLEENYTSTAIGNLLQNSRCSKVEI